MAEPRLGISGFPAVPTALRATRVGSCDGDRSGLRYPEGKCGSDSSSHPTGTDVFKTWSDPAPNSFRRLDGHGGFVETKELDLRGCAS